jgi:hypothetical protein
MKSTVLWTYTGLCGVKSPENILLYAYRCENHKSKQCIYFLYMAWLHNTDAKLLSDWVVGWITGFRVLVGVWIFLYAFASR